MILKSLGYVLVYFLRGELPWQGLKAKTMKEKYEKIMEKKISTQIEVLCKGFPEEIQVFIHYTRDLRFDDRPDYGFLKRLVKTMAEKEKVDFDYQFDWVIKKNDEEVQTQETTKVNDTMAVENQGNTVNNLQSNKATNNENTNSDLINTGGLNTNITNNKDNKKGFKKSG